MGKDYNDDDSEGRRKIDKFLSSIQSAQESLENYMRVKSNYQSRIIAELKSYFFKLKDSKVIEVNEKVDEDEVWESITLSSISLWDQTEQVLTEYYGFPDKKVYSRNLFTHFDKRNPVLLEMHAINKKLIVENFPEILDLDSNGFIELEYTVQLESLSMYDTLFNFSGYAIHEWFDEEDDW